MVGWLPENLHTQRNFSNRSCCRSYELTAVAFAIPEQALTYKHNNHNNSNTIKVNQQTSQANVCSTAPPETEEANETMTQEHAETEEAASAPTVCQHS
jgi:hypothetical protein